MGDPLTQLEEEIESKNKYEGCYLTYKSDDALFTKWSRTEVDDYLMFFSPGTGAVVKKFWYNQSPQKISKEIMNRYGNNEKLFNGVMEFFKMAGRHYGEMRVNLQKVNELGFKIYYLDGNGEDVITLVGKNGDGFGTLSTLDIDAVSLISLEFDDLKGVKKSNGEVFLQQGNQHKNFARTIVKGLP